MKKASYNSYTLQDMKCIKKLGQGKLNMRVGSFGVVYLVKIVEERKEKFLALKMMEIEPLLKHKHVDHVLSEGAILKQIDHPMLIKAKGFFQTQNHLYIAMNYVPGGELYSRLMELGRFTEDVARFYLSNMVVALQYLHSRNIVYRDLKPENILIGRDGYLKLADFGFAKKLEPTQRTYTVCGTPEYMAPQVILRKGHNKAADWWSMGILLYELLNGKTPFVSENPLHVYRNIVEAKISYPHSMSVNSKHLVHKLLELDLSKRYGNLKSGSLDIKVHKFFHGFLWETMSNKYLSAPYIPSSKGSSKENMKPFMLDGLRSDLKKREDPFSEW